MSWAESAYVVETLKQWLADGTGSGIPCNPCTSVSIGTGPNDVTLGWYNGEDLAVGEGAMRQVLARSFGVTIVAREGRPPRNVRDGQIVYQDPMDPDLKFLEDYPTGATGILFTTVKAPAKDKIVYYGVFARTDHGVLNYDTSQVVGMITPGGLYGFRQIYHEPGTRNIRSLHGCTQYKPVRGIQPLAGWGDGPTLGNWERDEWFNQIKPYMVNRQGRADYALNPVDPTLRKSGGASDAKNPNYNGGCFVWIPKVYVRERYNVALDYQRHRIFEMTPNATVGMRQTYATGGLDFVNPCFFNKEGKEVEGLWLAMYPFTNTPSGSIASGASVVRGKNPADIMQMQGWTAYDSNVVAFYGGTFMRLMRDLSYMVAQTTDIQAAFGFGYCQRPADFMSAVNPVFSNNASPGFYGKTGYDYPVQAFYTNAIASHDYWMMDPYTVLDRSVRKIMGSPNWSYSPTGDGYRELASKVNVPPVPGWSESMDQLTEVNPLVVGPGGIVMDSAYKPALGEYSVKAGEGSTKQAWGSSDYVYYDAPYNERYLMPRRGGCAKLHWESGPGAISWYPTTGRDDWQTTALVLIPPVGYKPPNH